MNKKTKFDIVVTENQMKISQEIFKAAGLKSEDGYMVFSFTPNMDKVKSDKKVSFQFNIGDTTFEGCAMPRKYEPTPAPMQREHR